MGRWSVAQVLALAPDAGGAAAGRRLATPQGWAGTGAHGLLVWGECAGSGRARYRVVVDLTGPAYRCSCPSRKFPCKHALGLLLLWSTDVVPEVASDGDVAAEPAAWRAERAGRTARAGATGASSPPDPVAAARRAAGRASRVTAGLDELERWLADQVRTGLAGTERAGYRHFDAVAARMVDAQAPGVAATLRGLAGVVGAGEGWPGRLLAEYGLLRLLIAAHRQLDTLPEPFAATVRAHVGYVVPREQVLATPPVRDVWDVTGRRDSTTGTVLTRRVWLRARSTGQVALQLAFATGAGALDASLPVGTAVEADVHFYPGGPPLRAVVGERYADPVATARPTTPDVHVADARRAYAAVLAADPWSPGWPVLLDVALVPGPRGWTAVDATGTAVPVGGGGDLWALLAATRGTPTRTAGEWTPGGFVPLLCWTDEGPVAA